MVEDHTKQLGEPKASFRLGELGETVSLAKESLSLSKRNIGWTTFTRQKEVLRSRELRQLLKAVQDSKA